MATVTWNSSASSSWNTAGNWTGGSGVPTSADAVVFDATSVVACTCDVAIDVASLTVAAGYSAKLDFADSSYSHAIGGDATFDGIGAGNEIDFGNATITIGGNLDFKDQGTVTRGTSTIVLTGSAKSFTPGSGDLIHNLTVSGSYTYIDSFGHTGKVTITTTGSLTATARYIQQAFTNCEVEIQSGGSLSGTGQLSCGTTSAAYTLDFQAGSTFSMSGNHVLGNVTLTTAQTLTGNWSFSYGTSGASTVTFPSGTTTFTGNVTVATSGTKTFAVADNSNNPSLVFQGGLTITEGGGSITWTKGTGTITLSGTANQTITTPAGFTQVLEDITINKTAGRVTLAGDIYTDSFVFTDGDLDLNGNTIDSAGSVSINGNTGARFWNGTTADMGGGKIQINSGTLTLQGAA